MNNLTSGIYVLRNEINGKVYVGQSANLSRRQREHLGRLKWGCHASAHLQRAWNRYGSDAFVFCVIEHCPRELLNERETFWIEQHRSWDPAYGYNRDRVALGLGAARPAIVCTAISDGKKQSGYQHTDETKRRISESKTGVAHGPCPEARRKAISKAKQGCVFTSEHRKKLAEAKKGTKGTRTGTTQSEAAKRKMSEAKKGKTSPRKGMKRVLVDGVMCYVSPEHGAPLG